MFLFDSVVKRTAVILKKLTLLTLQFDLVVIVRWTKGTVKNLTLLLGLVIVRRTEVRVTTLLCRTPVRS